MGNISSATTCNKCGNSIEINQYHHAGGVNDKYVVIYQCDECDEKGYSIAENFEQGSIKGASVVSSYDIEVLGNINDYLVEQGLKKT